MRSASSSRARKEDVDITRRPPRDRRGTAGQTDGTHKRRARLCDAEKEGTEDVRASRIDRCSRLFFARKVREGAMAHASSRASSCHWAPRSLTVADRSGDEHRAVSEEDHGVVGG
jgi:hypothetical protein